MTTMNQFNALSESDLEALKRDGILKKERFFPSETIRRIAETTIRQREHGVPHKFPARKSIFVSPFNTFKRSLRPSQRADFRYLSDVALQCGFKNFSSAYLGGSVRLSLLLSIESPISDQPITPWHTDANSPDESQIMPADHVTLKFFIYLNDIDSNNGAFAYLPGSHRLLIAIRELIYTGRIPFRKTYSFDQIRAACLDHRIRTNLSFTQQEIDAFFAASDLLTANPADAKYDLVGSAGTLLVFDDRGFHRGGTPRTSTRSILRYNYIRTEYWRPDLSPVGRAVNLAARAFLPRSVATNW